MKREKTMQLTVAKASVIAAMLGLVSALPATASPVLFSTGDPDGRMATASRPSSGGSFEIELADDFVLTSPTTLNSATFTGLIPTGSSAEDVIVEVYRVFPKELRRWPDQRTPNVLHLSGSHPRELAFRCRVRFARQCRWHVGFFHQRVGRVIHSQQQCAAGRDTSDAEPDDRRQRPGHRRGSAVQCRFFDPAFIAGGSLLLRAPGRAG